MAHGLVKDGLKQYLAVLHVGPQQGAKIECRRPQVGTQHMVMQVQQFA